jgi:hypothetical protein
VPTLTEGLNQPGSLRFGAVLAQHGLASIPGLPDLSVPV